ncbi:iron(III) transport system substrate-binding protein [Lysobacter sp. yr284]|uniref:ABC transporter substrate-binding protein n=1 Tax=Lysobacter sp. yr284 TaxID=1761791 RepID=UPI00089AAFF3|nr:ABC transporter substrate-binding protein [Lysobacter sp. yr284]SDZ06739.1 iron(III) transport system substrate-binding protein [Lysobacter sp. yr284]
MRREPRAARRERPQARGGAGAWRCRCIGALLAALAGLVALPAAAEPGDVKAFPSPQTTTARLRIHGSTDIENFAAVIADYQKLSPGTQVEYSDLVAQDIYTRYLRSAPRDRADLLISSGMDLQTKLVNDGHALVHRSPATAGLPAWSQWRHEAFGISYEPIVIVYNKRLLGPAQVPRTRRQLLALLRDPKAKLAGRVGTYDAGRSSVGYLLATQDHQLGSMAGALQAALGDNAVVLEERTGPLLDRVARGQLALAYNVLGSYAQARIDAGAPLGIVLPEDYTLVLLRTALIPREAANAVEAGRFLDYLISPRGQAVLARQVGLQPIRSASGAPLAPQAGDGARVRALRPIPLGPGLLVYLDALKRRQFLDAWRSTVQPRGARPGTPPP